MFKPAVRIMSADSLALYRLSDRRRLEHYLSAPIQLYGVFAKRQKTKKNGKLDNSCLHLISFDDNFVIWLMFLHENMHFYEWNVEL